jgi:single-stranded-DNA-specific exonuclease
VITVDNGITSVEAVSYLKARGVDVILVDHHLPKESMPAADAILTGESPLAACGLAFKLGWALLGDREKVEPYLDLVTLGTVADLAAVEGDNRILLTWGLPKLARSRRPGLRALMNEAGIRPDYLSWRDIAFGLGPRINAAGRMGSPMEAFRLLVTDKELEARNLAQFLEAGNRERQRVESEAYREASRRVEKELAPEERRVLVVESPDWHEGVLGIVAARLVERFRRPSIVIAMREEFGKGSGRSLPHFSLFGHVRRCEDLLESFGGHAQACGLTVRRDKLGDFRRRLNELARETFPDETPAGALALEAELEPSDLSVELVKDLERLAPFGPGHPRPLFVTRGLRVRGPVRKRGKDTLQCWMTDAQGSTTCEVIGFRAYERWQAQEKTSTGARDRARTYDIVYQPALRNANGITSITLELEAWE